MRSAPRIGYTTFASGLFCSRLCISICSFEKLVRWGHCSDVGWDICAHLAAGTQEVLPFFTIAVRMHVDRSFQVAGVRVHAVGRHGSAPEFCLLEKS